MDSMTILLPIIVGGAIVPVVALIKKTGVADIVRPEFISAILAIAASYGLSQWLAPDATIEMIIQQGLAALGGTSLVYGGVKVVKPKQ